MLDTIKPKYLLQVCRSTNTEQLVYRIYKTISNETYNTTAHENIGAIVYFRFRSQEFAARGFVQGLYNNDNKKKKKKYYYDNNTNNNNNDDSNICCWVARAPSSDR